MRDNIGRIAYPFVFYAKRIGWWNIWLLFIALAFSLPVPVLGGKTYQWMIVFVGLYWILLGIVSVGFRIALSWVGERLEPIEVGLRELGEDIRETAAILDSEGSELIQEPDRMMLMEYHIAELWQAVTEIRNGRTNPLPVSKRGPSAKRIERANIFKQIKDTNPHLSYAQVATRANLEFGDELGSVANEATVRNDYRDMGWEWERADRLR